MDRNFHLPFFASTPEQRRLIKDALSNVLQDIQSGHQRQFLSPQNFLHYTHGAAWTVGASSDTPGTMKRHSAEVSLHFEQIKNHDIQAILVALANLSASLEGQFTSSLVELVDETCTASGQVVSAKGIPFYEAFLSAIEKMEFSVTESGELELPVLFTEHPEKAKTLLDSAPPSFHERFEELKARKRSEALTREQSRKSKFKQASP
jgi:hypothetical protein